MQSFHNYFIVTKIAQNCLPQILRFSFYFTKYYLGCDYYYLFFLFLFCTYNYFVPVPIPIKKANYV